MNELKEKGSNEQKSKSSYKILLLFTTNNNNLTRKGQNYKGNLRSTAEQTPTLP
jgi:hypothetical protein